MQEIDGLVALDQRRNWQADKKGNLEVGTA